MKWRIGICTVKEIALEITTCCRITCTEDEEILGGKVVDLMIVQDQEERGKVDFLGVVELKEEVVCIVEKKVDVQEEVCSQEVVVVLMLVAVADLVQ